MDSIRKDSPEELEYYIGECQSLLRHMNLMKIEGNITIDSLPLKKAHKNFISYLARKGKINKVLNGGAILTGSKALHTTKINGFQVLRRNVYWSDWDFVCDKKTSLNISKNLDKPSGVTSNQMTFRLIDPDSYGCGKVDIDIIINDDLPLYFTNKEGNKIADPLYIISEKLNILRKYNKSNPSRDTDIFAKKHLDDIKDICVLFGHLNNE